MSTSNTDRDRMLRWTTDATRVPRRRVLPCGDDLALFPETQAEIDLRRAHHSIWSVLLPFLYPVWFATHRTWFPNNHNSRLFMAVASVAWFVSWQAMFAVVYWFWDVESGMLLGNGTLTAILFLSTFAFTALYKAWDEFVNVDLLAAVPVLYQILLMTVLEMGASAGVLYQSTNHACAGTHDLAAGCGSDVRRGFAYLVAVFGLFAVVYCMLYVWTLVDARSTRVAQTIEDTISAGMESKCASALLSAAAKRPEFGGRKAKTAAPSVTDSSKGRTSREAESDDSEEDE